MQKRLLKPGRPPGSTTFEPAPAKAFGSAVRTARTELNMAQDTLASLARIDRSHMGKIERGEHMPTLVIILRISKALGCTAAHLMAETEKNLLEVFNE
ncbi:helix-turn-helix domain-containing protein [Paenalcaligenes niemegkensis]|uniref:helix-turn-helix domain-containing protein n=1 Tax=Paenalcaligenes niemegkensis TaxID=2895469 RepID=UPI001EE89E8F|nr:helix-turn-helix transcriptional regulator [Paenalcaligenes niemegkensis]MCQ9617042.1 helix-turn-helix domain-containing protein [Paenalcaligenes niemegkensis]